MSEETLDPKFMIESLIESNNILQEEVSRLRNSNRILRTVHRVLRETLKSKDRQLELAQFNDEVFKKFCNGEFDAPVVLLEEGGLPATRGTVESSVATPEEASAPSTSS